MRVSSTYYTAANIQPFTVMRNKIDGQLLIVIHMEDKLAYVRTAIVFLQDEATLHFRDIMRLMLLRSEWDVVGSIPYRKSALEP